MINIVLMSTYTIITLSHLFSGAYVEAGNDYFRGTEVTLCLIYDD